MQKTKTRILILVSITIVVWLATFFTSLTMMWHHEWMKSDPISERLNSLLHWAAVATGLGLGVLLVRPHTRKIFSRLQLCFVLLGATLAIISLSIRFIAIT